MKMNIGRVVLLYSVIYDVRWYFKTSRVDLTIILSV